MTYLKEFSWLPVLEFSDIPHLAHAAARSICHRHHDHKSAGSSGGAVGDLIASILGAVDVSESRNWEQIGSQVQTIFKTFLPKDEDDGMVEIKRIMKQVSDRKGERRSKAKDTQYKSLVTEILLKEGDDKDKGAKVGLVLAGLMKYVKHSRDKIERKFEIVNLVLETILGGLTGVPVGGVVPAALQAGIVFSVDLHKKRQKDVLDALLVNVKNWYHDNIVNPLHTHGELTIKEEKVRVKTKDFEKWYSLMLRYNGLSETS